jgi:hypothetical protein
MEGFGTVPKAYSLPTLLSRFKKKYKKGKNKVDF